MGKRWAAAGVVAGILAVSVLESRAVWLIHSPHLDQIAEQSRKVATGFAGWGVYQNRILGPFVVEGLSRLPHMTLTRAFELFGDALLLAANALAFFVGRRVVGSPLGGWAFLILGAAAFVALQDAHSLYPWDFVDAVTMLLFAWLIWADAGLGPFVLLFAVELLNREAASFIALWMVLDGALRRPHRVPRIATGATLLVVGAVWTAMLRRLLLRYQPEDAHLRQLFLGQHVHLEENLRALAHPWHPNPSAAWIVMIALGAIAGRAMLHRTRRPAALVMGATIVSLVMFGVVCELRVWISVVPLVIPLLFRRDSAPGLQA